MAQSGAVVFLDFDGVMHPIGAGAFFSRAPEFRNLLAELDEMLGCPAGIVISSTWRHKMLDSDGHFDRHEASRLLGLDASRILGCTPHIDRRQRGAETRAWMEQRGWLGSMPWVFLDDAPGLFDGDAAPENALFVDGATGLIGPCWGTAARCLIAAQSGDLETGGVELARAAKAFGSKNASGSTVHSGAWSGFEHLAAVCAERQWLPIDEIASLCASAWHPELGARIALKYGSEIDIMAAASSLCGISRSIGKANSPKLWNALSLLSERSLPAARIIAETAALLTAREGLRDGEAMAIGVVLARAPNQSETRLKLAEQISQASGASLACLVAAERLGWFSAEDLASAMEASIPSARETFGVEAVKDFIHRSNEATARVRTPSSRSKVRI